ncbi:hypothetical protein [Cumulibacter manganitolerans]|uniref:hypothetical protein n=1 Tax=Cumulibacter manganitolerans TaxID=1884992 RepID=UPI0012970C3B|nr:hypothetical protein [Cumulibacter manganitolerans]
MSHTPTLSGGWRAVAAALALAWLGSVIAFLVFTVGGTTHRLAGVGFILELLAGLTVLGLLRNLGKVISEEVSAPGDWEVRLAMVSLLLVAGGWALFLAS